MKSIKRLLKNNGSIYEVWRNESNGFHRIDGPAVECIDGPKKGFKLWVIKDSWHRVDGPAQIWPNGNCKYYLFGTLFSKEEWFASLTSEQKENYIWQLNG